WRDHPFGTLDAGGHFEIGMVAAVAADAGDQAIAADDHLAVLDHAIGREQVALDAQRRVACRHGAHAFGWRRRYGAGAGHVRAARGKRGKVQSRNQEPYREVHRRSPFESEMTLTFFDV